MLVQVEWHVLKCREWECDKEVKGYMQNEEYKWWLEKNGGWGIPDYFAWTSLQNCLIYLFIFIYLLWSIWNYTLCTWGKTDVHVTCSTKCSWTRLQILAVNQSYSTRFAGKVRLSNAFPFSFTVSAKVQLTVAGKDWEGTETMASFPRHPLTE